MSGQELVSQSGKRWVCPTCGTRNVLSCFRCSGCGEIQLLGNYVPHSGQREFHDSKARFRVLACGRRWGKSKCGAAEMVRRIVEAGPDSIAFVVAPTFTSTSLGRCWREFRRYCPKELIVKVHATPGDRYIELKDGRIVYFKSADRPDTLAGEGLCAVWMDEPAQYDSDVWERVLPPALMERHGLAWFTGTPNGMNWYYQLFMEGQDPLNQEVQSWNHSSYQNAVENGGYIPKVEIDQIANRLPWQARQQEIMGIFLRDSCCVFRGVDECVSGTLQEPQLKTSYVAGLDLAKHVDFTVLIVMDDTGHVAAFDRFGGIEWPLQRKRVIPLVNKYTARLLIDSTGIGDPLYDEFKRKDITSGLELTANVEGYKLKSNAAKAELIENLSMMIEQKQISYPAIPELLTELKMYGWKKSKGGTMIYDAPSGYNDDCVIALALAAWQMRLPKPNPTFKLY